MSTSSLVGTAMLMYIAVSAGYMIFALADKKIVYFITLGITALAFITHTAAITSRVLTSGRLPLTNTYETLLLFSWVLTLISFRWQNKYDIRVLGAFTFPIVFLLLAAASLPQISSDIQPLLPSLKSNWLLVHVLTSFIAYAAFGIAFASGIIYLFLRLFDKRNPKPDRLELFDNITYRAVAFGYPLLTIGVVTGAIWANACWGQYWSWDPKETWALVTWIIYSICLHLRYIANWKGRWAAWAAITGFLCVLFTYLGVNYLFSGLHNYT